MSITLLLDVPNDCRVLPELRLGARESKLVNNHSEVFCKKGVLKNLTKFTGKHLCWSLFFKKRVRQRCFPVNFADLSRRSFL